MKMIGELSEKNLVCLWEKGGAETFTGKATIIAKSDGSIPKAIYVIEKPQCNQAHALVSVHRNYYILKAEQENGKFEISIFRVKKIAVCGKRGEIQATETYHFRENHWDETPPENLATAIDMVMAKALMRNCRNACFVQPFIRTKK